MKPISIRFLYIMFAGLYIFSLVSPAMVCMRHEEDSEDIILIVHYNANVEPPEEEIEEVAEPEVLYFDVPLDTTVQDHIFAICEEYSVDPALIVAMIERESTFRIDAVGDSGASLGLMQIQPRWNAERMTRLDCPDLLDPYQNITVGVDILASYLDAGHSLEWSLMAYNGGPSYANKWYSQGVISEYAKTIISRSASLERSV